MVAVVGGQPVALTEAMRAALVAARSGTTHLLLFAEQGVMEDADTGTTLSAVYGTAYGSWRDLLIELVLSELPACYHRDWRLIDRPLPEGA